MSDTARLQPTVHKQDARVAKALLESNTGHPVQLVSADTVPNVMFNTVRVCSWPERRV